MIVVLDGQPYTYMTYFINKHCIITNADNYVLKENKQHKQQQFKNKFPEIENVYRY